MSQSNKKIFVAGHNGMVGKAILRRLKNEPNLQVFTASRSELDLTQQSAVADYFNANQFDEIIIAAAKVGGIGANSNFPAEFIYDNLMIQCNLIHSAHLANVNKLLFLGSSCIYPKHAKQPIKEEYLLDGKLEPTNEPYAIAKIAGIKMCQAYNTQYGRDYRCVMPTNLYGPYDNFDDQNAHVIPALMQRIHKAKLSNEPQVKVWGTGKALREFLHVDDLADACMFVMRLNSTEFKDKTQSGVVNIGSLEEFSIRDLVALLTETIEYSGDIVFDKSKPDGTMRKKLDTSLIENLGWKYKTELKSGLSNTYWWFQRSLS
ncbi:GDP-L-fucose synthase family protein [Aliikangiella sp. IMCC44632]